MDARDKVSKEDALNMARHLKDIGMVSSTTEGMRMIKQGAVSYWAEVIIWKVGRKVKRIIYTE